MTVVPFQRRPRAAAAPIVAEIEQAAWEAAAVDHLRSVVGGRTSGHMVVSIPALNFVLARAERVG